MPDLPQAVQIDAHQQDLFFLLIADKGGPEPEQGLRKVHRPHALDAHDGGRRKPDRLAEARFQALGMEVQPDTVEPSTAPSFGGVGQKAVEQRRSKTGQLGLGMVRQGFGVERYSCDFRSNKNVIDPWLDLVPGAIASFHIISDKLLQRRGRLYRQLTQLFYPSGANRLPNNFS